MNICSRGCLVVYVICIAQASVAAGAESVSARDPAPFAHPVALYHLDEGRGERVFDSSGNHNDGEIVGGATWTDGIRGRALVFNGSNRVSVPSDTGLELGQAVSVSAWIRGHPSPPRFVEGYAGFRGPNFQVCGDRIYLATNSDEPLDFGKVRNPNDWHWHSDLWTGAIDINLTGWEYTRRTRVPMSGLEPKLQVVGANVHYEYFGQDSNAAWNVWTARSSLAGDSWATVERTREKAGFRVEQDHNIQVADGRVYIAFPEKDQQGAWQLWTASYKEDGSDYRANQETSEGGFIPDLQVVGGKIYYLYLRMLEPLPDKTPFTRRTELNFAVSNRDGSEWRVIRKLSSYIAAPTPGGGTFRIHNGRAYLGFAQLDQHGWTHLFTGSMNLDGTEPELTQRTWGYGYAGMSPGAVQVVGDTVYYVFQTLPRKWTPTSLDEWERAVGHVGYEFWTATSRLDGSGWKATLQAKGTPELVHSYKGIQVVGAKQYLSTSHMYPHYQTREVLGVSGANVISKGDSYGIGVTADSVARGFINAGEDYRFRGQALTDTAGATADSPIDDRWHHVVMTYDQQKLRLYVDGELEKETTYTAPIGQNPFPLLIGDGFQGVVDEIAIYPTALGPEDVEALYQQFGALASENPSPKSRPRAAHAPLDLKTPRTIRRMKSGMSLSAS